jgi:uncharacterized protein YciI
MFVIVSKYLKPVEQVDENYPQHAAWLQSYYDSGMLLGSGRRIPAVGGVILARGESREEILDWLAEDPFVKAGCAEYEVYEFTPNPPPRRSPHLDAWLQRRG